MTFGQSIGTLMLIDDEELERIHFQRIVQKTGLVKHMLCFDYAGDALTYLQEAPSPKVDVIALDINMPRMSGFDFLEIASEEGLLFGTQVVMLTSSELPSDRERAFQYSFVKRYFNKPLREEYIEELLSVVN